METVPCNLCGSTQQRVVYRMPDRQFFRDEWFSVVECQSCGLGFVNPRPTRAQMACHYPASYYATFHLDAAHHVRRYETEAEILEDGGTTGKKLLDVGCADGEFPRFMQRRGWDVEGVEIATRTDEDPGFRLYRCELPDIPVAGPTYDVVTAWAVIEHVFDPMAYFHKAAGVIKPGGKFVFLVTNFDSLGSRRLFQEDVPRHLYFFTEPTIRRYIEGCGMRLTRVEYGCRVYPLRPVGWMRYGLHRAFGRSYTFEDAELDRVVFARRHGLRSRLISGCLFALFHPVRTFDFITVPLYERWEIAARRHGIVTYTAIKPTGVSI